MPSPATATLAMVSVQVWGEFMARPGAAEISEVPATSALARAIRRFAQTDGDHNTVIPALTLHRRHAPSEPLHCIYNLAILPRSRHLPRASTEGSRTRNVNKNGVRLWTDCSSIRKRKTGNSNLSQSLPIRHRTPNLHTVLDRYVSPGCRMVVGNAGWFGESGKCWVSRHSPLRNG